MKVAIIGAGVAGITAAYQLAKGGVRVDVFEAADAVGGLSRTIELWGQRVDLGPHRFFSSDGRVNRLWLELAGDDYRMVDRLTRIYYRRRFFHYPLKPRNALWNMGPFEAARCTLSYMRRTVSPRAASTGTGEETFESWVVDRFGRRLFEMFFKSYSEKLWGIPCSELDADFAAQRIKRFSLGAAIRGAVGLAGTHHKTLVDRFAYPLEGTGMIYRRMAERVCRLGGTVRLGTPIRRVLCEESPLHVVDHLGRRPHAERRLWGVELADGQREPYDRVISTMPLTLLVRGLPDLPPEVKAAVDALQFRNTILVYLHVDGTGLFPDQWLYVHSPELRMGRVTNFRNWVPELYGDKPTSILALEYWCYDHDAMWTDDDQRLIELGRREIAATGLVDHRAVREGHVVRLHRCYPVYRRGYKEHLARIVPWLKTIRGLTAIGRYGAFKYNNQDHSILMGILAAENLLHGRDHDLWAVNTDYDAYQEDAATIEELARAA
jgi:protoporphyrinogen oxidase